MIKQNTVFVLGAGASSPYGYPTGMGLRNKIIDTFPHLMDMMRAAKGSWSGYIPEPQSTVDFVHRFRDSRTNSIDLFLSRNSDQEVMVLTGKVAIATIILDSEAGSTFDNPIFKDEDIDWYNYLYNSMTNELRNPNDTHFVENKISFITFNYDRSLEAFLHQALINSFGAVHTQTLEEELHKITIVHVYGVVAALPWQGVANGHTAEYPIKELNPTHIHFGSEQIRVIDEDRGHPDILQARKLLKEASRVFFLGFGFAPENLEILGIPDVLHRGTPVFGTVMNLHKGEIDNIKGRLAETEFDRKMLRLESFDSNTLLRNYL